MSIPAFDPKELEYIEVPGFMGMPTKTFQYPLNKREHGFAMFSRKPWWQGMQAMDAAIFVPRIIPDDIARGMIVENSRFDANTEAGGPDMFGVEWEYIQSVGGSMVRPGKPFLEDISEWEEKLVWPDIDSWDWEGSAKLNNGTYLREDTFPQIWFFSGYFERLISLLEFEGAAMALMDEDSQEYVHSFFNKLTDLYIRIFDKINEYFPLVKSVFFHDDWGSQRAPFFSKAVCDEMLVPYLKRVCESAHKRGMYIDFHSCGQVELLVPCMIEAGVDIWSGQPMNDRVMLLEKYGDKIKLNLSPNAPMSFPRTPEEAEAAAKAYDAALDEFMGTYGRFMKSLVVSAMNAGNPKLYERIYTETREAFAK